MAKRVDFTADFIFTPERERRVSTKYRAGMKRQLVTDECAAKAIALGRAALSRGEQPGDAPKPRPARRRRAQP